MCCGFRLSDSTSMTCFLMSELWLLFIYISTYYFKWCLDQDVFCHSVMMIVKLPTKEKVNHTETGQLIVTYWVT